MTKEETQEKIGLLNSTLSEVLTELNNREQVVNVNSEVVIAKRLALNLNNAASLGIDYIGEFNASNCLPTKLIFVKQEGAFADCEFLISLRNTPITETLTTSLLDNIHVNSDGAVFDLTEKNRLILDGFLGVDVLVANGEECLVDAYIYGISL